MIDSIYILLSSSSVFFVKNVYEIYEAKQFLKLQISNLRNAPKTFARLKFHMEKSPSRDSQASGCLGHRSRRPRQSWAGPGTPNARPGAARTPGRIACGKDQGPMADPMAFKMMLK